MSFHPNDVARRARNASIIVSGVIFALLTAFFRSQVLDHKQWVMQSEDNRLRQVPIPAPRGTILDRNGLIIAENAVSYSVSLLAKNEEELRTTMLTLGELIPMSKKNREDAIKRYRRDVARPTAIFPDASFDQVAVLEEHRVDFPSLIIQAAPKRVYPDGKDVSAFVGYTSEISENELITRGDTGGYRSGQQIGKSGLEAQYERSLRGQEGSRFVEVDAKNRVIKEQGARPDLRAVPGKDLKTNIDLDLQRFVAKLFGDSLIGGVVAVDPKTGGILAIHSAPGVDPNRWIGGMPQSLMDSLRADTIGRPQLNKALQGLYPPGSTFKLAMAVMGLKNDPTLWKKHFSTPCNGSYYFGNRAWKCWDPRGHGFQDLAGAIKHSCDVYFYQLGLSLTIERLSAGGVTLGFANKTGIDLPNESKPRFPDKIPDYMDAKYGKGKWNRGLTLNLAIGQGENSQTILNVARFYSALATDGSEPTLRVAQGEVIRKKVIDLPPDQLNALREAMLGVTSAGGTAASAALQGVALAGKTGTAQSGRKVNGVELNHAWFAGLAPAGDPKIVVVVMLEFGGHGTRAARIASAIIGHYLKAKPLWDLGDQG